MIVNQLKENHFIEVVLNESNKELINLFDLMFNSLVKADLLPIKHK